MPIKCAINILKSCLECQEVQGLITGSCSKVSPEILILKSEKHYYQMRLNKTFFSSLYSFTTWEHLLS